MEATLKDFYRPGTMCAVCSTDRMPEATGSSWGSALNGCSISRNLLRTPLTGSFHAHPMAPLSTLIHLAPSWYKQAIVLSLMFEVENWAQLFLVETLKFLLHDDVGVYITSRVAWVWYHDYGPGRVKRERARAHFYGHPSEQYCPCPCDEADQTSAFSLGQERSFGCRVNVL